MRRPWLPRGLALTAVLFALAAPGCGASERGGAGGSEPEASDPAPDFTLPDLSGRPITLADYRGKTVVIDFWATWCPPCIFQVPELNALWEAHQQAGDLMVIGMAVDAEGVEVVAPWAEEQGVEYTIVIGDETLAKDFGVLGFPTLVVVTPEGRIDSLHAGLIELEELEEIVAAVKAS